MDDGRVHRTTSADGTEIVGRVIGQGPPLVLVPGGPGDGEISWRFLLPLLTERLTCYAMNPRGKGLSAQPSPPDYARERLVGDIVTFVEQIGEPVGLMGHSSGGSLALEAAANTDAVSALALYEPNLPELADEEVAARYEDAEARARRAATRSDLSDAARIFYEDFALANDEELATVSAAGVYELVAPNIPAVLEEGLQGFGDLTLLGDVTMPVLLLQGSRTHPHYVGVVHYLAARLADARVHEIAGAGHLGPQLAPHHVAEELVRFFAEPQAVGGREPKLIHEQGAQP